MPRPDSSDERATPTQASFEDSEWKHQESRASKLRISISRAIKVAEEHDQLLEMRKALSQALRDDEAEEQRRIDMVLQETLEQDRRREEVKIVPTLTEERTSNAPKVPPSPSGSLKRTSTMRNLQHVFVNQRDRSVPRSRSRPKLPRLITQFTNSQDDEDHIRTATPFIPQIPVPSPSHSQLLSPQPFTSSAPPVPTQEDDPQPALSPIFPTSPLPPENRNPKIGDDGLLILTPYISGRALEQNFQNLPVKLQQLLRPNVKGHWPYIQEWFRNQDDADLDETAMEWCRLTRLNGNVTLWDWDQNVELARRRREEEEEDRDSSEMVVRVSEADSVAQSS